MMGEKTVSPIDPVAFRQQPHGKLQRRIDDVGKPASQPGEGYLHPLHDGADPFCEGDDGG